MPTARRDVAWPGQRVTRKILIALGLSSAVPLGLLCVIVYAQLIPLLRAEARGVTVLALQALIAFAVLLAAGGAWMIWNVAASVSGAGGAMGEPGPPAEPRRSDEIGGLMESFSRMVGTVEGQAEEINSFAARLDAAYRELENTNSRLKEFSFKDDVTGLYNRRFFSIRLEEEISRYRRFNHPVSIVLLDLDGFKDVNDHLGHAAGDEGLREIARILLEHSRGINVISRYGGDEFAVLLVETPKAGARLYADRIRQVVSDHPFTHGFRITASFGIASLPEDMVSTPQALIRVADDALYAAKRGGKNRVAAREPGLVDRPIESGEKVI